MPQLLPLLLESCVFTEHDKMLIITSKDNDSVYEDKKSKEK